MCYALANIMTMTRTRSRSVRLSQAVLWFGLPLLVLMVTSLPGISGYTLHLALLVLLASIVLLFVKRVYPEGSRREGLRLVKTALLVLLVLLLVGATGWFFSPFFFLLYLVPLYLGFLYTPLAALAFLSALLVIFASSVGEVDLAYDMMILLSLLLAIPLVIYLRRKYLILKQGSKDILILEEESGIKDMDTISRLLANRITNLGVSLRQPLTYIKQASTLLLDGELEPDEAGKQLARINTTASEALEHIKQFEGKTSANVVLGNGRTVKKP